MAAAPPPPLTADQLMLPVAPPAATGRWAILLPGPTAEGCLCTDPGLGSGHQSSAHVVLAPPQGENLRFIVRKIRKNTYSEQRLEDRADREVRICNEVERRVEFSRLPRPNIVRLLAALDIPRDEGPGQTLWRRSTFWDWCNMGSTLQLRDAYAAQNAVAPPYVLARFLRQGLEVINWLMHPGLYGNPNEGSIFHQDMHAGNIFVHWDNQDEGPNFFVGDFGFAKFAGEPPSLNTAQLAEMSPLARQLLSTPRDTSASPAPTSPLAVDGERAIQEWDVHQFLLAFNTTEDSLLLPYNMHLAARGVAVPATPPRLLELIRTLTAMNTIDSANARGIRSMWPGYQDLTAVIAQAHQYENEEKALHDAARGAHAAQNATQRAMFAAHMAKVTQSQQPVLENFKHDAAAVVSRAGIPAPYTVVDCNDAQSVVDAARDLAERLRRPQEMDWQRTGSVTPPPRRAAGAWPPRTPSPQSGRLRERYHRSPRAPRLSPYWGDYPGVGESPPYLYPPASPTRSRGAWLPYGFQPLDGYDPSQPPPWRGPPR